VRLKRTIRTGARMSESGTAAGSVSLGRLSGLVGYALRRAQLAVFADFVAAPADLELRPATFSVLAVIAEHGGLCQVAAGEVLGRQRANVVPLASELVSRGANNPCALGG
jgi:hypothetical protein